MGEIQGATWDKEDKEDEEEEAKAQVNIWKYIYGFVEVAVMKCAIELGIADAIESHGSPMTLSEISSTLRCDPSFLYRIMRFLMHQKIFKSAPTIHGYPGYAQTPLSRRLIRNGEHSMSAYILWASSAPILAPWHKLSARVLDNGSPPFENSHGEDLWNFVAKNNHYNNLFNEAMECDSKQFVAAILKGCSEVFDGVSTLVDVGGGNGTTLRVLTKACPWIRGINYDLPHVIDVAPQWDGVEHVAGDMFQSVPEADAVFLKWILHDWGDEECVRILKNCRKAIPKENGKVLIVDHVIDGGGKDDEFKYVGLMMDMVMMTRTNSGKERTLKEWDHVIKMAGFSSYTVKSIHAVQSVIMAFY